MTPTTVLTTGQLLKALLDAGVTVENSTPVSLIDDLFPDTSDYKMSHVGEAVIMNDNQCLLLARGRHGIPIHKNIIA